MSIKVVVTPYMLDNGKRRAPTEAEAKQMVDDLQSDRISDAELDSWIWTWVVENNRPVLKAEWPRHV